MPPTSEERYKRIKQLEGWMNAVEDARADLAKVGSGYRTKLPNTAINILRDADAALGRIEKFMQKEYLPLWKQHQKEKGNL